MVRADVTYEGTTGTKAQVFTSNEGHCTDCHVSNAQNIPSLEDYDEVVAEIDEILIRINVMPGDPDNLMPLGGPKLSSTLRDLVAQWNTDGVPDASAPQLTVSGHSSPTDQSAKLHGSLKENGRETDAFFKYWQTNMSEPANCPAVNSVFEGCTTATTAAGSGGDDLERTITANANGLTKNTGYTYRAISIFNGRFDSEESPTTLTFTTESPEFFCFPIQSLNKKITLICL